MPKYALWRVGVRTGISKKYSPLLDYTAKTDPHVDTDERMTLSILTSRAFKRGKLISENAARGIFPSYAPCPHAVETDLREMHKRDASRQLWLKQQRAAEVGYEPSLPNFCNAANVCYHGGGKNAQQPLGF